MKEIHFDGKVAQKAVIERDGKVLVIRDVREVQEIWELPGGRLNEGEEVRSGLSREIFEELGVEVVVGEVVHLQQFFQSNEGRNALMIAYAAKLTRPEASFVLEEREVAEVRWVSQSECQDLNFFPEYKATLDIFFAK